MQNGLSRKNFKFVAVFFAALGLMAPSSVWAGQDKAPGDPGRGAKLWADNCNRCHNMRDPKEFRDDQWRVIVMHMRVRGGLIGQDTRDILAFLQAAN